MEQLHENIRQLTRRLTELKDMYNQQKLLIAKLKQENERLKRSSQQKQPTAPIHDPSKVPISLPQGDEEKERMRQLLVQYIQQIDQCIAFLEQTGSPNYSTKSKII